MFISRLRRLLKKEKTKGHANTDPFFQCLVNLRFSPRHVVDIGAHLGGWTRSAMKYFPAAQYSLFEPQRNLLESQLDLDSNKNLSKHYVGLGACSGTFKLTASPRADSFSFRLSPKEAAALGREQFDVEVITLDSFFSQNPEKLNPDLIKIDAEGWDLEVLQGAKDTLQKCEVVLLEAGVMNKSFKNTAGLVIHEMESRGFVLFDITDLNRTTRDNALWNVELAFVRKGGRLELAVDSYV